MRWAAGLLFVSIAAADTPPIADEALRLTALRAVFPGMQIAEIPGKRIGDPSPRRAGPYELDSPDALAREKVYGVVGAPTNQAELCAAENLLSKDVSKVRELRFELFPWPRRADLLAVIQYEFKNASPAGACWSLGLLVRLEKANGTWIVRDRYLLDPQHHTSLLSIRLLDLGGGIDELVVEPDFGGAGTWGSLLLIFDLSRQKFDEVLGVTSRISYEIEDMYTQTLDVPRTIAQHDGKVCLTKITMFEKGRPFTPPRVTKPCYSRGVEDARESAERQKWLAPLKP